MPARLKTTRPRRRHFVAEWRASKQMTQAQLAAQLGMSEASISRIEDGKQPYSQDTLEGIAEALGVDPYQLIKGPPGDTPSTMIDLDRRALVKAIAKALGVEEEPMKR